MNGNRYTESTAILHIVRRLRGPIQLMACFRVVPVFIRNPLYRFIARNRYKCFGKQTSCMLPTPETKMRFWIKHTNGGKQCVYQQKRNFV